MENTLEKIKKAYKKLKIQFNKNDFETLKNLVKEYNY